MPAIKKVNAYVRMYVLNLTIRSMIKPQPQTPCISRVFLPKSTNVY